MILQRMVDDKITNVMNNYGAFFSFSNIQFEKKRDKNIKNEDYISLDSGIVCPRVNALLLVDEMSRIYEAHAKYVTDTYSTEQIIKHELMNHEIDVTGDITDTADAVECYGITRKDILAYCEKYDVCAS